MAMARMAMEIVFNPEKKGPAMLSQTRYRLEKTVKAPNRERRKIWMEMGSGRRNVSPNKPPNKIPKALRNAPVTP